MSRGRPAGVTTVAILGFLEGVLLGAVGLLPLGRFVQLSFRSGHLEWVEGAFFLILSAILLIFAFLFLRIAMGLWKLQRWARVPSILFALLILLLALVGLLMLPRLGGTLLGLCLFGVHSWAVWYLLRTPAKDAFSG